MTLRRKCLILVFGMQIGYQFVMRWVNNHIYYMKQKSPLGKRILEKVAEFPFEDTGDCACHPVNVTILYISL